jgi:transposase
MLRRQGYKFEAQPNGEQLRNLRRFAGACRFVYNKALALNKEMYEHKGPYSRGGSPSSPDDSDGCMGVSTSRSV